jgi:hypothetical protein
MDVSARLAGLTPWSGMIAAGTGWFAHQQVVSGALHFDCHALAGAPGMVLGMVALGLVFAGAFVSWRALPPAGTAEAEAALRRFVVHLSLMAALLATLGIAFQILAGAIVPGCRP